MAQQRVVLITAGASGIGRVIAESFIASGDTVHICDVNQTSMDEFFEANPSADGTLCDVSDVLQVNNLFDEVEALHGRLDVLVNNAGVAGPTAPVEDIEPCEWDKTIGVDLNGVFYCTRRAAPMIRAAKGCIINMSSNAGLFGFPLRSPYTAAKWAVIGLTKTWAMELGPEGVTVNAICPGYIDTPMLQSFFTGAGSGAGGKNLDDLQQAVRDVHPMRTYGTPQDVANLVNWLASDEARYASGQLWVLDGGLSSQVQQMRL